MCMCALHPTRRGELLVLALSVRATRCSQRYSRVHELDRARQQREEHEEERRGGGDLSRQIQPRVLVRRRQIRRALEENDQQAKVEQNRVVARKDRLPQRVVHRGVWGVAMGRGGARGGTRLEPQQQQADTRDNPRCACIGTSESLAFRLGWIGPVATLAQAPGAAGGGVAEAHADGNLARCGGRCHDDTWHD